MPVSMTSGSGFHRPPSARAAEDAARLRAKASRSSLNPGPGSYDPRLQKATSEDLAGSTAFKSKSDRKKDVSLREVGDPGSYHPYENMGVASQSARSFNKSSMTGAGGFGSRVKRAELSTPNDAPGPGTYNATLPGSPEARQGSAFASQTKRGAYLPKHQTPGAGEYDPADRTSYQRTTGGDSMFRNREGRFRKSMDLEYSAHVGPGSYSGAHNTVAKTASRTRGKASSAFASTSLRGDLFMGGP